MFEIVRYTAERAEEWNNFVAHSKNGTFLFNRGYMDYHSDRFSDYSMMFYRKGELYALLPANQEGEILCSHRGLTYGGLIMNGQCKASETRKLFLSLNNYLSQQGFQKVIYKHIPWVYCSLPSEEDLFAMINVCHATICSRDIASVVCLSSRLPLSTLRRRGVRKAMKVELSIMEDETLSDYWQLLEENLRVRHHASPVHSLQEIQLLKLRFPHHIRLFVVKKKNTVIGGTVLYVCGKTVKTQYISTSEEGRKCGALDFLFQYLLDVFSDEGMMYFDFGTSNIVKDDDLNESLIFQKEGFGGRGICYDTYEWKL